MNNIHIEALPAGNLDGDIVGDQEGAPMYYMTCSECGPIGMSDEASQDIIALDHLEGHGIDTAPFRHLKEED